VPARICEAAAFGIGAADGDQIKYDGLAGMRCEFEPRTPLIAQGFEFQDNWAMTDLPLNSLHFLEKCFVVDMIDLRLVVAREDCANRECAPGPILDHGLDGFIFRMSAEKRHDVQIISTKLERKRLDDIGQQPQAAFDAEPVVGHGLTSSIDFERQSVLGYVATY
jgi:hypothetical protein